MTDQEEMRARMIKAGEGIVHLLNDPGLDRQAAFLTILNVLSSLLVSIGCKGCRRACIENVLRVLPAIFDDAITCTDL